MKWKAIFIVVAILICIYSLIGFPTFPTSLSTFGENFKHQIKLGLDLQGGTHLVIQVQVEEAIAQETDQMVERITTWLRGKNYSYDEVRRVDDTHVVVRNVSPDHIGEFRDFISQQYGNVWDMSPTAGDPNSYTLTMLTGAIAQLKETTMNQSLETIDRRINALGLTEPIIQLRGGTNSNEILVQLPGEGDPGRVEAIIKQGGQLELNLVEDPTVYSSEAEALSRHGGVLPPGTALVPGRVESSSTPGSTPQGEGWYILTRAPIVTGRDLRSAQENRSTTNPGQWIVDFTLSADAATRFGPFTQQNIGHQMAVVLDHHVYTAPVINGRIDDSGMIEGNFSQQSAHDLAIVLRAGALPASIKYLEERTVGPSLGADSIRHGVEASVLSLLVVMIFMLIYYRLAGANAVLALILNLVILLAVLALFGAVLTLPGIAGVILTIGMGVDSNVLVFERIREELRAGKSAASSVDAGFEKAFLTIIDTHVTTVVSAFFLFIFGSGPIRGFAVSLTIGLIANIFTAIYVSKAIFQYHLAKMDRQAELSI
ncbi:MAG TPA: protein translocase subunit SecD [Candidatus Acidoferrum sp.]|nr:protein translocase subunit SecD [Candidatus Acidoferrum sp.]